MTSFKCLFVAALLVCVAMGSDNFDRQDAVNWFEKLKGSEMGKEIYTSIQLELSTSTKDTNLVDRILSLLQELFDSLTDDKADAQHESSDKKAFCATKLADLETEVEELNEKVSRSKLTLPTLVEAHSSKVQQYEDKSKEVDANADVLKALNDKNEAGIAAYKKTVQEHNDLIAALEEAKKTISQLAVSSFLQTTQASVLAQIQSIGDGLSPQQKMQRSLINVLVDLSQNVGKQANQDDVASVIAIIDELIEFEGHTSDIEKRAEQLRKQRYEYDVTRFEESTQFLDASIKDLQADAASLNTKIVELQSDNANWVANAKDKTEQQDLQKSSCDQELLALEQNFDEYNNLLDIVREVIRIFKSSSISDIKSVVEP